MKTEKILVANVKCGGCANTIRSELLKLPGVKNVTVTIEQGSVEIEYDVISREVISSKLKEIGYPETADKKESQI